MNTVPSAAPDQAVQGPGAVPAAGLLDAALGALDSAHQALFEHLVQPLVFGLGLGNLLEDAFVGTLWLLVGLLQLAVIALVFGALERWRQLEPVQDRPAVRVDLIYTLIHRLGLFKLVLFLSLDPVIDGAIGKLRLWGFEPWQLDAPLAALWPGVTDTAVASFCLYLVVFDFLDYAIHRGQHGWNAWWQLHALHHSQRQMTRWSDNRNHLLDDLLRDLILVVFAALVGIAPGQFVAVVAFTQLLESLSHANARLSFGPVLSRVLVGPAYHRLHHAMGQGHETGQPGSLGGHNFAVLFPVWDVLFGTARFDAQCGPTGIRDQWPEYGGRDYGQGFWAQQRLGLARLFNARAGFGGADPAAAFSASAKTPSSLSTGAPSAPFTRNAP